MPTIPDGPRRPHSAKEGIHLSGISSLMELVGGVFVGEDVSWWGGTLLV